MHRSGRVDSDGAYYTKATDQSKNQAHHHRLSSGASISHGTPERGKGLARVSTVHRFGMKPFGQQRDGGIQGMVLYASTPAVSTTRRWMCAWHGNRCGEVQVICNRKHRA